MNKPFPLPAACPLGGTAPASSPPFGVGATFSSAPFDTECQADLTPLDVWATDGGAVAACEQRHTARAVGGQSERGPSGADAGLPPAFSLTALLEDARLFERDPSHEGQLSYLCNIVENLLRARPGMYAEDALRDFLSSLELALENEAEDRKWNDAERVGPL